MAKIDSRQNLVIELEGDEIASFARLISDVKNAYQPKEQIGFKQKPKFEIPDDIGELSLVLYYSLFGTDESENNQEQVDYVDTKDY